MTSENKQCTLPPCPFRAALEQARRYYGGQTVSPQKPASPLPPDPDDMNDDRSEWAGKAVEAFREATGCDEEDALGDLLTDLMHWADRQGLDFRLVLDKAKAHYEAETIGEAA